MLNGTLPAPRKEEDKHDDASSYGVVYVNNLARDAMLNQKKPYFPPGSIIVREKLAQAGDTTPQLLAVMVKRTHGFSRKSGDWEFLVMDGAANKIQERQKTGSCLQCHTRGKENDFVFRSYLSESVRRNQK